MMHNTEDKKWRVIEWEKKEELFVSDVAPWLKIKAIINPEKQNDPYAPDLYDVEGKVADLKCQQAPFFKSGVLYQIPNQYAVTFNNKGFKRYNKRYPSIAIYYWLDWVELNKSFVE